MWVPFIGRLVSDSPEYSSVDLLRSKAIHISEQFRYSRGDRSNLGAESVMELFLMKAISE